MTQDRPVAGVGLLQRLQDDEGARALNVRISYEIIRLFSEGLYQSPHKAIEELVTNSFDADATVVRILTPRPAEDQGTNDDSLWVIDNGAGMDEAGFEQLWKVADSTKYDAPAGPRGRLPIGQFGIGKLAAYVLAWRLTHVSKARGQFHYTSMDFRTVSNRHQYDPETTPLQVRLHSIGEARAREVLSELEGRDPDAWRVLFGAQAAESWTAAALSDFKPLFSKLRDGVLGWVLRTSLPLVTDFNVFLNGMELVASKVERPPLHTEFVGGTDQEPDADSESMGLQCVVGGIEIPGIPGKITGTARIYEHPLTGGKSDQYGRSHGFFVRVRGRVINVNDELFGLDVLNHSGWSRFSMEVDADGLREHLLSSREGVRESEPVVILREYLHKKFNACRNVYERERRAELVGLDIQQLLHEAPSRLAAGPLLDAVREELKTGRRTLYYVRLPDISEIEDPEEWIATFESGVAERPFDALEMEAGSPYERLAKYSPATRKLTVNQAHPFVSKLAAHSKNQTPVTLFASSEVLADALLRDLGVDADVALDFFELRDRALRLLAGDEPPDPAEVLRQLNVADLDKDALEQAVGEAFGILGLNYEKRGGNKGGPDGILDARLGRQTSGIADFKLVYDAKTTNGTAVPADKVDFASVVDFQQQSKAQHAFVVGKLFEGQSDRGSKLSRKTRAQAETDYPIVVINTLSIRRLVELHLLYGVTLGRLRDLFTQGRTPPEVDDWIVELEAELTGHAKEVPLKLLLDELEHAKRDVLAIPNARQVRGSNAALQLFDPDKLIASLQAISVLIGSKWMEVNPSSGDVLLHHSAEQIIAEVQRRLADDLRILG